MYIQFLNGGRNASYQHPLEKARSAMERRAQVQPVILTLCQHVRVYPCSMLVGWKKQSYVNVLAYLVTAW